MRVDSQLERLGRLLNWVRLAAVPLAFLLVALHTDRFPPGHEVWAWVVVGVLAVEAPALFVAGLRPLDARRRTIVDVVGLAFDVAIVFSLVYLLAFEPAQPMQSLAFFLVVEGALRFGVRGGLLVSAVCAPLLVGAEVFRVVEFDYVSQPEGVLARVALLLLIGMIIGHLTEGLTAAGRRTTSRAEEAEALRDQLARRVDLLDAANRCARALGSSLELEQAFKAFIRELRGLVPFDRMAIVLAEGEEARVMAAAGEGARSVFPPGSSRPVAASVMEEVLEGQLVYRADMEVARHPEEEELRALGLRCRLAAPLMLGARTIGMLSLARREADSFTAEERELVALLGRLVATAVQNIRAYEAERETAEELRRLSALRADFVSLVSHELRSPMAAVIGAARTLQERWRQLSPPQRESFLALIEGETSRLASLISDVLDTSRIEAGTFTFSFDDVDVESLVRESVAAAEIGQDEVRVRASVRAPLPAVRGDRERLRQVLSNLIDNALKYSSAGDEIEIAALAANGQVQVSVKDQGPGVPREHQKLIFEKFGRARTPSAKPGTGLGLFIARSIAEAHGGSLDVRSAPGQGATFTLALPTG